MTLRKVVFWLHRAAGLAAGLVVAIMSLAVVFLPQAPPEKPRAPEFFPLVPARLAV